MKNYDLLVAFNQLLRARGINFHLNSWSELEGLKDEELSFIFDKVSMLLTAEGISEAGEINDFGILCDDICGKFSVEMCRRKDFKLEIPKTRS